MKRLITLIIVVLLVAVQPCKAAVILPLEESTSSLYDYYNTGANSQDHFYGVNWSAQTFTPAEVYSLTSVKLMLFRVGSPGTITVHLRNTLNGLPTGIDLASSTINGNVLTTNTDGNWYEVLLSYILQSGTKYAIVIDAANGTSTDRGDWKKGPSSYSGGNNCYSSNSGSSWTGYTSMDNMFECWGAVPEPTTFILLGLGTLILYRRRKV